MIDTPTQYFPCRPDGGNYQLVYTLGQAFLQAAFIGIDWNINNPPGNWFMAQAPGPNIGSSPFTTAMQTGVSELQPSNVKWEDTWTGHWTPLSDGTATSSESPAPAPSSGLSTGAKAGIGAGAAVALIIVIVVIGAIFWMRRRKHRNAADAGTDSPREHTALYHHDKGASSQGNIHETSSKYGYYDRSTGQTYELDGVAPLRELPASRI